MASCVSWKVELLCNVFVYLAEKISKQSVECATLFFFIVLIIKYEWKMIKEGVVKQQKPAFDDLENS